MKKLYPLLSVLFLFYWGCEYIDTTPTEVTLWGVVYSVEDTDSLDLGSNQLTGEIPETICNLVENNSSIYIYNNQLCPPYPSCVEDNVGEQDTSGCD